MSADGLRRALEEFLASQDTLVLATVGTDGVPMAHGMHYVAEGAVVYMSSLPGTRKLSNIAHCPTVGYAAHRLGTFRDRHDGRTVQAKGHATVVEDPTEVERVRALLKERLPWAPEVLLAHNVTVRIDPVEVLWVDLSQGRAGRHVIQFTPATTVPTEEQR